MIDALVKLLWPLVIAIFTFSSWVLGIQFSVSNNTAAIARMQDSKNEQGHDIKTLLDFMSRMDERLKNIERRR